MVRIERRVKATCSYCSGYERGVGNVRGHLFAALPVVAMA